MQVSSMQMTISSSIDSLDQINITMFVDENLLNVIVVFDNCGDQ